MNSRELRTSTIFLPSGKKFCIGLDVDGYTDTDKKFIKDLFALFVKDGLESSGDSKMQSNDVAAE